MYPLTVADPGFPRGGGANWVPTYDFAEISQKLHEIERILTRGCASLAPLLDPPLVKIFSMKKFESKADFRK